jgi:hypothetical protein
MGTTAFILLALDALLAGILGGVLIYRGLERSIKNDGDEIDSTVTHVLTIRPNGLAKDKPEVAFKNDRNPLTPEELRQIFEPAKFEEPEIPTQRAFIEKKPNNTSAENVADEPEIIIQEFMTTRESQKKSRQSAFVNELEINLRIATAPWKDTPVPFQTTNWDAKHGKVEPGLVTHLQDLIQLYVDISLANNVVWLATEIGHRSKELDESYIKLCRGIAERIKGIVPVINEAA